MMRTIYNLKIFYLTLILLVPLLNSCNDKRDHQNADLNNKGKDLSEIRESGKLRVVTDFSSVNYFIYRGKPMGFQYELLQELSDYLDLEIEVSVNNDLKENFNSLVNGDVDLIASNLTVTEERQKFMDFVLPHSESRQVLVQRTPTKKQYYVESHYVRDKSELGGKTIYVQQNSSHAALLKEIAGKSNTQLKVLEVPIETEQLIKMVSRGEIEYTVADEDVALVNQRQVKGIDIHTVLSVPENQAWAVRKESPELASEINKWMEGFRETRRFAILQNKYFKSSHTGQLYNSGYNYSESGRISPYDEIFKREADRIGWDWRLIASMVYQESRFNPGARSYAGAFGLMQLMPRTAERFGVNQYSSARDQINAGIRFVQWLDNQLKDYVPDQEERRKFVLASYNIGLGHVMDAMRLAEKYGADPALWENNVEKYLLKKSEKEYYSDPVVKHGYARGTETYTYVRDILYRYNHYLNLQEQKDLAQLLQ